ncbi:MAG: alpha/beta hydrolase [Chthoniobacterales bacterium]
MKTHHHQTHSCRGPLVGLVLFLALSIFAADLAQSAEGRRRRADSPNVNVVRDLVYEQVGGRSLRLDIYSPKTITGPLPVVLWIHGGHWGRGTKEQRQPFDLTAHGYAVVSIEYRLAGEAPFPAQIEDCKAAVRWLRANAATYHLDPDHIGAWGHSAGGHLAALLGTSGGVAALEGNSGNLNYSSRIQAVCAMSSPFDLVSLYEEVSKPESGPGRRAKTFIEEFLGGSADQRMALAKAASPTTYISKDDAAFLVIHGENDMSIPVSQSEEFVGKLKAAGVDATLEIAEGRGHGVGAPQYAAEITSFFDKYLKNNPPK